MSRIARRWLGACAALVALLIGGSAVAADPPSNPCTPGPITATLAPNSNRLGIIDLHFLGAGGGPVAYFECVGGRAVRLGERYAPPGIGTTLWAATYWRCGRLTRQFAATTKLADGTVVRGAGGVRTVSCARRFGLELPKRVARGGRVRVKVVDRWRTGGIRMRLCLLPPRGAGICRSVVLVHGTTAVRYFRPDVRGRWRAELRVPHAVTRAALAVGVAPARTRAKVPLVLATGDSTMQGIESFLSDELGASAEVESDVRPGLGISKGDAFQPIAVAQVRRLHPATTVVSIGANEGFSMVAPDGTDELCCDEGWVAEYARRVRTTMQTYLRRGRGRVCWLTIPAPKDPRRVPVFAATNRAILRAAEGLARVRVLRMDTLFSPNGFRETMRYRGAVVRVREKDGIHLNVLGTKIAARVVAAAMREP